jgi:quercetin dioxygenase-like cupin family protein
MRIQRLSTQPAVPVDGGSRHFGAAWEVFLEAGEATQPHQHEEVEEIYYCVEGTGEIVVATKKRVVGQGEIIYVPRLMTHHLANTSSSLLRCLTIESTPGPLALPAVVCDPGEGEKDAPPQGEKTRETVKNLDLLIEEMPRVVDRVTAIQQIVQLFDIGGRLSEQIEEAFGLDNDEGVAALSRVETRIMDAVIEITRRYKLSLLGDLGDLGGFGGRLRDRGR